MLITIIIFILVLSVLVFVHELGHFLTARKLGVKADEFGFGFPPRIFGLYKDKQKRWRLLKGNKSLESLSKEGDKAPSDTVYSLNWIFAGGFVKIKGENGDGKADADSFSSKAVWKRALILVAGVVMNVVLAWVFLSIGYLMGMPGDLDDLGPRAKVQNERVMVIAVLEDSPADKAGLKPGEAIVKVNGESIYSHEDLQNILDDKVGQEVLLNLESLQDKRELSISPILLEDTNRAGIGVVIYNSATIRYPFFDAFWQGAKSTAWYLRLIVLAFYQLFADIFAGENVDDQVGGPVAIAKYTGEVARFGLVYLLQFIALLSLNLAIINILPIPALDGGRLLFLGIEKIKGKPINQEVEAVLHTIFFFLLIALIIFVTYRDILSLF